jgi:hypothetical protein
MKTIHSVFAQAGRLSVFRLLDRKVVKHELSQKNSNFPVAFR